MKSAVRTSAECLFGVEDWHSAALHALGCTTFRGDVDEEQIADEAVSCYNCRYRRWLAEGISCLADPS